MSADRLTAVERAVADLRAQQNGLVRHLARRLARGARSDFARDQRNLDQRLATGSLTGRRWQTRGNTPDVPDNLSAPLIARLTDITAEGSGYGATEEEPGVAFYDLSVNHLPNGSFAQSPPDGTIDISNTNPLPGRWTLVRTGTAITARSNPSVGAGDRDIKFSMVPGSAGDELLLERVIRIPPSIMAHSPAAVVATGTTNDFLAAQLRMNAQYLLDDGVTTTGSLVSLSQQLLSFDGIDETFTIYPNDGVPPPDAAYIRIRVGLNRGGAAVGDSASLFLYDIRLVLGFDQLLIANVSDPFGGLPKEPGQIIKDAQVLVIKQNLSSLSHDTGSEIWLDGGVSLFSMIGQDIYLQPGAFSAGSGGVVYHVADQGTWLKAIAAGPTPSLGYYAVYPKTDGHLYGKNDSGTERLLDAAGGGGTGITPAMFFLS